jgi:uncharacterized membrane protein YgcG
LFLFTLIIVGAAVALFFTVFLSRSSDPTSGTFFLIFAAICYTIAELAVSKARLHRYGIEEALAVCSVGFLCAGMQMALFNGTHYSSAPDAAESLVPMAGAFFSLWIWHRFGLSYAFLAAMIFVVFLPGDWTTSHSAQHVLIAMFYAIGLVGVVALRSRRHLNHDYLDETYSIAEAMLWLGIYLSINLQLAAINPSRQWWDSTRPMSEFPGPFYWTTWVLIWCLPPIVLARGIRQKDRFVIVAAIIVAILTFISNKPYLGWQRHTWDPMLLGILLTGVAFFLQRWLGDGPDGIRHGFTAARLSGKDKHWMNLGSTVFGLLSPHAITPEPQASTPEVRFGGGQSGGGGASSDF